ncbi:hypothetical protein [Alteromonas sp. a30]|uniref:hypothetical protein n=1 Tax=Alteromonas sp. a30 TaxID=2730917 RepID=UPI002282648E|nr:hypothetical protein [Alteromonas sp. a30]MCY7297072.1 hypothetical protein [Alteromonas sp. a30]
MVILGSVGRLQPLSLALAVQGIEIMSHKCKDFLIEISASGLVNWTGEEDENCIANPYLVLALNLLDITIDPVNLYDRFFSNTKCGRGDVYLYQNHHKVPSYFAIDMYRGLTDQLDVIQIAIRAETNSSQVKVALRGFIDTVENQFCYEESSISSRVNELIDLNSYPKEIEESGYKQHICEVKGC